jgi:hypothetical protein
MLSSESGSELTRRVHWLQQLGVTAWLPRRPLPLARPSAPILLDTDEPEAFPGTMPGSVDGMPAPDDKGRRASGLDEVRVMAPPASVPSAVTAQHTPPAEALSFRLVAMVTKKMAVLAVIPETASQLPPACHRFMANVIGALGGDAGVQPLSVTWPLESSGLLAADADAARDYLEALSRRTDNPGIRLCFGSPGPGVLPEGWLCLPEVSACMESANAKRQLWQVLRSCR